MQDQGKPAALSLRQKDIVTTQSLAVQLHRIQDDMESVIEIHQVMYIAHAMVPETWNIRVEAVHFQGMSGFSNTAACQCMKICHTTSYRTACKVSCTTDA